MRRAVEVDRRGSRRAPAARAARPPARSTSSTSHDGQRDHARARRPTPRPPSTTAQPSRSSAQYSSSSSGGASARGVELLAAQRLGVARGRRSRSRRRIGCSSVPARRTTALAAADRTTARRSDSSCGARRRSRRSEPSRPCGRPTRPTAASSRVNRRCRRARGDCRLTAAALTTVRSALAVRPPRPMTFRSRRRRPTARGRPCRRPPRTPRPSPRRARRPAAASARAVLGAGSRIGARRRWPADAGARDACVSMSFWTWLGRLRAAAEPVRGCAPRRARSSRGRSAAL